MKHCLLCISLLWAAVAGAQQLNDKTYWFGNTWGGGDGPRAKWMQQSVDDIVIHGNRIYAITPWDEHCGEAGIYGTDGSKIGVPAADRDWPAQFHSWGFSGGFAVATDGKYVIYSMKQNGQARGKKKYGGVSRYTVNGKIAGWKGATHTNRLIVNTTPQQPTGLAVHDGELFVSDPATDKIRVYRTETMAPGREMAFTAPGRIEVDAGDAHDLWVIDTRAGAVRRLTRQGRDTGIRITDCKKPVAVCLDARGNVLVADGALDRQQIRSYTAADGKHIEGADFGSPVYRGETPGIVRPGKFFRLTSIRVDADNNLYVSAWDCGGQIYKFGPDRKLRWNLEGLEFVSCADADPQADTSVYAAGRRYELDYTKPPGRSWKEAAITLDPLSYPHDPRLHRGYWISSRMFRLGGRKIMLGQTQMGNQMYWWRFDGEIAVPAAMYFPRGVRMRIKHAKHFSGRWSGWLQPRVTGKHTIRLNHDDGARVKLGDAWVINGWKRHGRETATIEMKAGKRVPLVVEYRQFTGASRLDLSWQEPGKDELETIPAAVLFRAAEGADAGLQAEFFKDTKLQRSVQKRIDPDIRYRAFVGDPATAEFGNPKPKGYPPQHPLGPFLWVDANGDGDMQQAEYQAVPPGSHAAMMDVNGDLWINTGGWKPDQGKISKVPFTGCNKHGVPTWDFAKSTEKPIPTDTGIHRLSKLSYDAVNDCLYLGVWTRKHPFPGGGWEQMSVGPVVQCYANWSTAPKLRWETVVVPPEGLKGKVPKAWSIEPDYTFIGYTWKHKKLAVDIYDNRNGKRVGRLLPTQEIGGVTGWIDMNDGIQTHKRADGTYVVFTEEVWMAKGLYFLWQPEKQRAETGSR